MMKGTRWWLALILIRVLCKNLTISMQNIEIAYVTCMRSQNLTCFRFLLHGQNSALKWVLFLSYYLLSSYCFMSQLIYRSVYGWCPVRTRYRGKITKSYVNCVILPHVFVILPCAPDIIVDFFYKIVTSPKVVLKQILFNLFHLNNISNKHFILKKCLRLVYTADVYDLWL